MFKLQNFGTFLFYFSCILFVFSNALPTTLLENTKTLNIHTNKVKRTSDDYRNLHLEEPNNAESYYSKPSAKKRGGKPEDLTSGPVWEAESEPFDEQQRDSNKFFDENLDDKTLDEYEKGFRYGTNKEKLDEQLENAILKSELYGDPTSINQYRYYGREDARKKRSNMSFRRMNERFKREIAGNPDDDLMDLISLWEAERKYNVRKPNWHHSASYYNPQEYENSDDILDDDDAGNSDVDNDENWLEAPIYPNAHSTGLFSHKSPHVLTSQSPYYYETVKDYYQNPPLAQMYAKRQWVPNFGSRNKRFMVSRKRSDPTRELKYFTGPNHSRNHDDNIYTLAQLLSGSQRDPNVPLYHRAIL